MVDKFDEQEKIKNKTINTILHLREQNDKYLQELKDMDRHPEKMNINRIQEISDYILTMLKYTDKVCKEFPPKNNDNNNSDHNAVGGSTN